MTNPPHGAGADSKGRAAAQPVAESAEGYGLSRATWRVIVCLFVFFCLFLFFFVCFCLFFVCFCLFFDKSYCLAKGQRMSSTFLIKGVYARGGSGMISGRKHQEQYKR